VAEPLRALSEIELEAALSALGSELDLPAGGDLAAVVAQRLRMAPRRAPRLTLVRALRPGRELRPLVRPGWQRVAAAAAAVLVLATGTLVASPGARRAVAGWLGLRGERITVVPSLPGHLRSSLGAGLTLGQRVTLSQAQRQAAFRILVPRASELGQPDEVYVGPQIYGGQVTLLYRARPGLPKASTTGAGLLVTEFAATIATPYIEKMVGPDATIEALVVGGRPAYWIAGRPHAIEYRDRNGDLVPDSIRLAGNVLVWERGDVTLRLEGRISKPEALRIAASVG
jgi:hypothetical protein